MVETTKEIALPELIRRFSNEDACRTALEQMRWPDGPQCPHCESVGATRVKGRETLDCNSCHHQFSVRVGTVLQDSKLPLWTWFLATYMMVEARKGVSSNQLKRMLGVSYKTAWFLSHRIRAAMRIDYALLTGTVELDETYVGGKLRYAGKGVGGRGPAKGVNTLANKTIVLGALARDGNLVMRVEKRANRKTAEAFIASHVAPDTPNIYTDGARHLRKLGEDFDTNHESVNHEAEEWVRGDVHTNGIESAWSLLKRSIMGSYHQLSAKHLPAYLDEMEWRFNNRENPYLFRDTLKVLMSSGNLEYSELIA
jgi:transposase-like protein